MLVLQILVRWFREQSEQQDRVAFMLPLYYLQRGRTAEALHAYSTLKETFQNFAGKDSPSPLPNVKGSSLRLRSCCVLP